MLVELRERARAVGARPVGQLRARPPRSALGSSPVKYSHSFAEVVACMPWTRCIANMCRSALKSPRPTKHSTRFSSAGVRWRSRSACWAACVAASPSVALKSRTKLASENWYIELTAMSALTRKKSVEPSRANGRYTSRCWSSSSDATELFSSASAISLLVTLVCVRLSISDVFSRMSPSDVASASSSFFSSAASSI